MKILIVDDNRNNRMILQLLLEDYEEDNGVSFKIDEAKDGLDALNMCKDSSYDVVFMDIMMPNMDGIESTKAIRKFDSKVMIIAVSAVDDGERKKLILSHGAEDYIPKPINADIFISRVKNYILLVESRNHKRENKENINLFTKTIFNRHLKFIIESEDSLSEFWEYYLLSDKIKYDGLSDVVRTLFAIVEKQISLSINSDIYIEESEEKKYFTLTNIDKLPLKVVELIIKKNSLKESYKVAKGKISIVLNKNLETIQTVEEEKEEIVVEQITEVVSFEKSTALEVFTYLDDDDLYDLEEYTKKLSSILLVVGSGDITYDEVMEIYTNLEKLASILASYSEVYTISKALSNLASDMYTHLDEFIKNSDALGPMCKAFSNDMSNWVEQSFHTGAPSIDFMNDTIAVNCQTIGSMLKMDDTVACDDDFDDIFDF